MPKSIARFFFEFCKLPRQTRLAGLYAPLRAQPAGSGKETLKNSKKKRAIDIVEATTGLKVGTTSHAK